MAIVFLFNVALGSVNLSLAEVWGSLIGSPDVLPITHNIVWDIRLPRALATIFGGASLATYLLFFAKCRNKTIKLPC